MRSILSAILFLCLLSLSGYSQTNYKKRVIDYSTKIDVRRLDPVLNSESLDAWLRFGPAKVDSLLWELHPDCNLKVTPKDEPLCVKFIFRRGGAAGWGMIQIGAHNKWMTGTPRLKYVEIGSTNSKNQANAATFYVRKLSEVPAALDKISVSINSSSKASPDAN